MKILGVFAAMAAVFYGAVSLADPTEAAFLQQLVVKAQTQVEMARQLVENSKHDGQALDQASRVLTELSSGINQSIASYQGSQTYEKALLKLQAEKLSVESRNRVGHPDEEDPNGTQIEFQQQANTANAGDLEVQSKLARALQSAGPGFVGKLQTQAQLGSWQTNTRLSTQMTQVLGALQDIHSDLKASRQDNGLHALMRGMAFEKTKQATSTGGIRGL